MSIVVFAGPTIAADRVRAILDCDCRPPAAQGDIYRAARDGAAAIGLIDGTFEGTLSVWHKEILWAMAQGVHVFGAASMGALRAAELVAFGMRGAGRIFEGYRDGSIEDDDEVALLYGPAETGYAALTEPLVNVRATLERAVADGVIPAEARDALVDAASATFYRHRTWPSLLALAGPHGAALSEWLPGGRVDRKQLDAVEMLEALRDFMAQMPGASRVDYHFEWTHLWDAVVTGASGGDPASAGAADEDLLSELRLEPDLYRTIARDGLLRMLAVRAAPELGSASGKDALARFRKERGLLTRRAFLAWLEENRIDEASLAAMVEQDADIEALQAEAGASLRPYLLAALLASPELGRLQSRAVEKQAALAGDAVPAVTPSGIGALKLLSWYFAVRLGRPMPDDMKAFAASLGLATVEQLVTIVAREHAYFTRS